MRKARVTKSRIIYRGPLFGVRQDRLVEPGGIQAIRDVVTHAGSVVLLPVFKDGTVLLVRQYRHAVGRFLWELAAGRIEPGEKPLAAARRELAEETGYVAGRLRRLVEFFPSPGFLDERMIVYLAEDLHPGRARPEADERILVRRFSLRRLEAMIRRGRLRDGKSIAAILFYSGCACRRE